MGIKKTNHNQTSLSQSNGELAEKLAQKIIIKNQHHIISTNYHCRFGEIDIISTNKNHVIFTEVRHRSYTRWGGALESINQSKQSKITKTAEYFLSKNPRLNTKNARFDVICFEDHLDIELATWIQHAFLQTE